MTQTHFIAVIPLLLAGALPAIAQTGLEADLRAAASCVEDVGRLCADALGSKEGIRGCVKDNITNLSQPCFDAMLAKYAESPSADFAATATPMSFEGLRGVRYCELNFIYPDLQTGSLYTEMWNSTGLNNADPKNTCPADVWAKVDAAALAKEHKVMAVWKNGPRGWTVDRIDLPVGEVTTFDGWQGRWYARPNIPKGVNPDQKGSSAYKPLTVERSSTMTFLAGQPVFILDDPQGTPWVMQAYGMIVDPGLTYDGLADLGSRLQLAEGWKFRVKVLDQDLTISAVDGKAEIVQDDLQNTYDACFETACTYKP